MNPHYSPEFFQRQQEGSIRSARQVLPYVFELTSPASVVDVGCGVGTWLSAARALGVLDTLGIDGAHIDPELLQIPKRCFRAADLSLRFECERTFDLALSLEVAEHLPEASAPGFVESLTRLAPLVLFSAAIPRQSGSHHINEQWQSWWVELFNRQGFVAVDCVRHRFWNDSVVEWWYAQNTLLMVRRERLAASPRLQEAKTASASPHTMVHPRAFLERLAAVERSGIPTGICDWLALAPGVARASAARFWHQLSSGRSR
jgi:SAM-dependent methyltransferase